MSAHGREAASPPRPSALPQLGTAPELHGVQPWLNTAGAEELTLKELRGGVVLLEFWTFGCSNCQRTLPFLRRWHRRYQPEFTVVAVHTPEFPSERRVRNVELAVLDFGLEFPVGVDNDYVAWHAYDNRYWPTQYLIDRAGEIRYMHIGEGSYAATEEAIRALLAD